MMAFADIINRHYKTGSVAGLALLCASCASIAPAPSASEFAATESGQSRAERVFLYQSRVANALLDEYPLVEIFQNADSSLIAAEARMTESCGPLTRAVLAHLEGQKPSLGLRFEVFASIDDCERSARKIDRYLNGSRNNKDSTNSI